MKMYSVLLETAIENIRGKNEDTGVARLFSKGECSENPSKKEGSQLATKCSQLKIMAADGKYYKTDVADTEQIWL